MEDNGEGVSQKVTKLTKEGKGTTEASSEHVWFANDQLAVRFIEEIDFDYAATAVLLTAAS